MFTAALKIVGLVISLTLVSGLQSERHQPKSFQTNKAELITSYQCEYYDKTCIDNSKEDSSMDIGQCFGLQLCNISLHQVHGCMVAWNMTNATGELSETYADQKHRHSSGHDVHLMGCLPQDKEDQQCPEKDRCVEKRPSRNILFCCCTGDMCNKNFSWVPIESSVNNTTLPEEQAESKSNLVLLYILIPTVVLAFVVITIFYGYKQQKSRQFSQINNHFMNGRIGGSSGDSENPLLNGYESIQLQEVKARGRFGDVWKGIKTDDGSNRSVAVKVFPPQEKNSWASEQEVYKLLHVDHTNILKFLGVQTKRSNPINEFWLMTEFHEKGSLCDFLKYHLVSWEDLCKIARGMAAGLNHLHEEMETHKKPAIAHRDFKSKNVLIKSDMTACLADFGLALIFEPGKPIGDTYPQVGTRRYMAPEVLEGAIIFSRDQFLRIDMYACGLVLWELATRCTAVWNMIKPSVNLNTHSTEGESDDSRKVDEYKLPFEDEAGVANPTLEQMQELVVNQRIRPLFNDKWKRHCGMAQLKRTIDECWDQDAEARISASCVMERMQYIQHEANESPKSNSMSGSNSEVGGVPSDIVRT